MLDVRTRTRETKPVQVDGGRRLPVWSCLLIGAVAAGLGLVPWLATGTRLPLQNLWNDTTAPGQMPRAMLPFSQYEITVIIGLLVTGGTIGGLFARSNRRRLRRGGFAALTAGLFLVQVVALVQTATVVHAGLQDRRASDLYLGALTGVAALSIVFSVLVTVLIGRAPRGGALVGFGIAGLALVPWLGELLIPFGTITPSAPAAFVSHWVLRWIPAVVVGIAVAWAGIRTVGRVAAVLIVALLLWLVPALTIAIVNSASIRVLASDPTEIVAYAAEVFVAAATTPALVLPPLVLAAVIAVAGGAGVTLIRRVRTRSAATPADRPR